MYSRLCTKECPVKGWQVNNLESMRHLRGEPIHVPGMKSSIEKAKRKKVIHLVRHETHVKCAPTRTTTGHEMRPGCLSPRVRCDVLRRLDVEDVRNGSYTLVNPDHGLELELHA